MALLSAADRTGTCADYMRDVSAVREQLAGVTKADLLAAVNAVDQWIDDNSASFNSAIPQPARSALTTQQKADLFLRVLRRRVKGQ